MRRNFADPPPDLAHLTSPLTLPTRLQDTSQTTAAGMDPKEPCRHDVNSVCAGSKEQSCSLWPTGPRTSAQIRRTPGSIASLEVASDLQMGFSLVPHPSLLRPIIHLCKTASRGPWQYPWEPTVQPPPLPCSCQGAWFPTTPRLSSLALPLPTHL